MVKELSTQSQAPRLPKGRTRRQVPQSGTAELIHAEDLSVTTVSDLSDGTTAAALVAGVTAAISGTSGPQDFYVLLSFADLPKRRAGVTQADISAALAAMAGNL